VVGVPLITLLGQTAGWRVAYLAIAAMFALTLLAVSATVPYVAAAVDGSPRAELRAFRSPVVWLVAAVAAIGFAGFFAVNSYIAPVTTQVAGLSAAAVPWALVFVGLGMTIGNAAGGWCADRNLRRTVLIGLIDLIAAVAVFGLIADTHVGLFLGAFLIGGTSLFLGPPLQAWLIEVAPSAQLMGAAINQSAMNIANSIGAALGGLVIARGFGYLAPAWVGVVLGLIGLALAVAAFAAQRRAAGRPTTPEAVPVTAARP
jgi:DHA1 family inner membrane transport protein